MLEGLRSELRGTCQILWVFITLVLNHALYIYICISTSLQVAILPGVGPLEWSLTT